MTTIRAFVRDRRLDLAAPPDWPDGTLVEIHPVETGATSAGTSRNLTAKDERSTVEITEADIAAWQAERQTRKDDE